MSNNIIPENWTGTVAENARSIDKYLHQRFDLSNELNELLANKESTSREWKAAIQYQQRCQQLYDEAVQAYNDARSACEAAINDPECDSAPYAAALNDAKEVVDRAAEQLTLANKEVNRLTLALSKLKEDINSKINAINSLEVPVGINNRTDGTFSIDIAGLESYRDQYYNEWLGKFAEIHEDIRKHITTIDTIYGSIPNNTQLDMSGHIEYFQADNANINKIIGENRTYFGNYVQYLGACIDSYKDQVDDSLQEPILLDIYQLLFDSDIAERVKQGLENIDFGQISVTSEDVKNGVFMSQTELNPDLLSGALSFKILKDGTVEILSNGKKIGYTTASNLVENAGNYTSMAVPQNKDTSTMTYERASGITNKSAACYSIIHGTGKYEGRVQIDPETGVQYIMGNDGKKYHEVAMGSYYGKTGDTFKITTANGTEFYVVKTDEKSSADPNTVHYQDANGSGGMYHNTGGTACIIEFVVDGPTKNQTLGKNFTAFDHLEQFGNNTNIVSIEKMGSI